VLQGISGIIARIDATLAGDQISPGVFTEISHRFF
jgi:hypothetical protein